MIKRGIDLFIAIIVLILVAPLFIVICLISWWTLKRPIFFIQERIGFQEKPFKLIKLRTMKNHRNDCGELLPDEHRMTVYGSFLRKYSLDELPTLFNVIKGDMSLVGPRPLLPEYLSHYTSDQRRRHCVKPGITGLAQIKGRNALTWEDKFTYDILYVDTQSLWLDFKILFQTFLTVLRARNVSHHGHVTMPRFDQMRK
ncbi:MAG TPA: sugar transferase [Candidatus Nitrosotenuis sp.]|nr:sugar transferase [Candidatus Nitrosotenuis sp.]